MSGGSYNYAYNRVREFAEDLEQQSETRDLAPEVRDLRGRFAEHLRLVAKAMHDIEWVDSADYGEGGEVAAIRAVLPETPSIFLPSLPAASGGGGAPVSEQWVYALNEGRELEVPDPLRPGDVLVVNGAGQAVRWEYTVEDAEADIGTAARALADYEPGGPWPDEAANVAASRCEAARMLLKLTPWRAAVPVPSPGFVHVQQVAKRGEP
jgi:hypothetical protein